MTHAVVCQNDAVNYDFAVIVDDKIAMTFPYKSWYFGGGYTSAQAAAENLTINLSEVFSSGAPNYVVDVDNNGKGFDIIVNDKIVTTYPYSGVWVVGGLLASKTSAMANAYQLGQNLSTILGAAYHQH